MVTTIVNMPQGLSLRALTTTIATPARVAMTMKSVATAWSCPADRPEQVARDLRQRQAVVRTEATSTTKSWTPPARQAPMTIQVKPGK